MVHFESGSACERMLSCDKLEHCLSQVHEDLCLSWRPDVLEFVSFFRVPATFVVDVGVVSILQHACETTNFFEVFVNVLQLADQLAKFIFSPWLT